MGYEHHQTFAGNLGKLETNINTGLTDMTDLPLKCTCGNVHGVASDVTPSSGTRVICYCGDCQAFARYLKREDEIVDRYGGTEVFQLPASRIKITQGDDQIQCMRLTGKGAYRWYAGCCRTPIGNTLSPAWTFVGVIHNFIDTIDRDAVLGPVRGLVHTKYADASMPDTVRKTGNSPAMILRSLLKILAWKLRGLGQPSPFFDTRGKPVSEPVILS